MKCAYRIAWFSLLLLLVVSCQSREIYKPASQAVSNSNYSALALSRESREGLEHWSIDVDLGGQWFLDLKLKYLKEDQVSRLRIDAFGFLAEFSTDNFQEGLTTKKIKIEGFPEKAEVKLTWWKGEEQYEGKEVYQLKWSK
ncbi:MULTISPECIES: hypothetical protein [Paenibacillus]|uniref:Lipoprotein n=1 Tax=Paenibacillus oceani TaxID=2772510 RepID=A0A927H3U1_9BACL|nr:hypothetical protein [Paenibacillus oceani]MBD2865849.1 hypothetical protein [Paenibacillus oceani]